VYIFIHIHIYVYIYVCVCVCVCIQTCKFPELFYRMACHVTFNCIISEPHLAIYLLGYATICVPQLQLRRSSCGIRSVCLYFCQKISTRSMREGNDMNVCVKSRKSANISLMRDTDCTQLPRNP